MKRTSIFHSEKFILRPFRRIDEESLVTYINNRKIAKNTQTIPYPYTYKEARAWINHCLKIDKQKNKSEINFAIDIKGNVVGGIGLKKIENYTAEIGYWLGEKYWGRGIMTLAIQLITQYGFTELGLKRVYANVFSFNKASIRVLEKAGYRYEGRLSKDVLKSNKLLDCLVYSSLRSSQFVP